MKKPNLWIFCFSPTTHHWNFYRVTPTMGISRVMAVSVECGWFCSESAWIELDLHLCIYNKVPPIGGGRNSSLTREMMALFYKTRMLFSYPSLFPSSGNLTKPSFLSFFGASDRLWWILATLTLPPLDSRSTWWKSTKCFPGDSVNLGGEPPLFDLNSLDKGKPKRYHSSWNHVTWSSLFQ